MKYMTLREVGDAVDVSRRAVQGYEKVGLVSASGKNEYGHLLYDASSQERIKKIKFFQQLGFTVREIQNIIDAPNELLKSALEERVKKLKAEKEYMECLISRANEFIETL